LISSLGRRDWRSRGLCSLALRHARPCGSGYGKSPQRIKQLLPLCFANFFSAAFFLFILIGSALVLKAGLGAGIVNVSAVLA
jgi:hypothetical protein